MDKNSFSLAEAIKMAIDLEKNGRKFYQQAADKTESESGKKIFKMLAHEEMLHLATFEKMLKSMDKTVDWREMIKGYPQARQVPVFDKKEKPDQVRKVSTDELEALRIAMKQEREAIEFFDKVMAQAEDETTKKIFDFVREQEVYHYDLLQAEYDYINHTGFWFDSAEFRMDGKF